MTLLENSGGRLLVYASDPFGRDSQLSTVSRAAEKIAQLLQLNLEVINTGRDDSPICVCFQSGEEEPVPIFQSHVKFEDAGQIYERLKKMMFVLSFHPRYTGLRQIRKEVLAMS